MKSIRKISIFESKKTKDKLIAGEVSLKVIDRNGNIIERHKSNTVVVNGRNTMMQKLSNIARGVKLENGQTINDARSFILHYFALGSGGAPQSNPFNPTQPSENDYRLSKYIYISDPNSHVAHDKIHKVVDGKAFASLTQLVVSFTLDFNEGNPGQAGNGNRVFINEACLSLGNTTNVSQVSRFIMFTRATFSTVEKNPDRKFIFEWHLYF